MYRILITGSRNWVDEHIMEAAIVEAIRGKDVKGVTLIHGNAKGADTMSGKIARFYDLNIEVYPADWETHGKAAGPIRNSQMVKLGADVCLAFPLGESRGTRHCMKIAEKAGIPVRNFGDEGK